MRNTTQEPRRPLSNTMFTTFFYRLAPYLICLLQPTPALTTTPHRPVRPAHPARIAHYSDDEITRLVQSPPEPGSLNAEIELTRILIDRVMARMSGAQVEQFESLVRLNLDATGRLATLLKTNRQLSGESTDKLAHYIAGALDEIGQQLGLKL